MGAPAKSKRKIIFRILFIVLLLLFLIRPAVSTYERSTSLFGGGYGKYYPYFKRLYSVSQYSVKNSKDIIPDQALEAYAGGAFLKGLNPILIIHDQPPLGRYIIAFSIMLFDNSQTLPFICLVLSAVGVFLISQLIIRDAFLSLIPFGIFINEPLFFNKISLEPLLEPIQLPFIVFSIYFFMLAIDKKNNRWLVPMALMLGGVISIRFFALGAVLAFSFSLFLLFKKMPIKTFVWFFSSILLSIIVLFASYFQTINQGSSLLHIIGIQKYILIYHKQQLSMPFSFIDLLLFNRWHTWWGNRGIISDSQWNILWPISIVLIIIGWTLSRKIKLEDGELIILLWVIVESIFLSLGEVSTRYFLPLVPFLYILAIAMMKKTFAKEKIKKK